MTDYTDEDVQRASDTLNAVTNGGMYDPRGVARAVLAAVLPEYRRRVLREAADVIEGSPLPPVPATYMKTDFIAGYEVADALTVEMLRARADAEEAPSAGYSQEDQDNLGQCGR
jgi:hypothetical protein